MGDKSGSYVSVYCGKIQTKISLRVFLGIEDEHAIHILPRGRFLSKTKELSLQVS